MSYLVDANVLSEPARPDPNPNVIEWLEKNDDRLFVATPTLGEIRKGISLYPDSRKRRALERWFRGLLDAFDERIIPFDLRAAIEWGAFYAEAQKSGRKPPLMDSLISAVARSHNLTVASRNIRDMHGVKTINPWIAET